MYEGRVQHKALRSTGDSALSAPNNRFSSVDHPVWTSEPGHVFIVS